MKQKPPYGMAGWTKAGRSVLIYDEYDIWEVAPDGSTATKLTNGAPEQIRYRYVKLDPKEEFIDLDKPVYLSLYGQWTKRTGYARLTKTASGANGRPPVVDGQSRQPPGQGQGCSTCSRTSWRTSTYRRTISPPGAI